MAAIKNANDSAEESKSTEKEPTLTKKDAPGKAIPQKIVRVDHEDDAEEDEEEQEEDLVEPMRQTGESRQNQHVELIRKLRLQLRDLEKFAFERGELKQIPISVLAERQSMILDILREKLSLNICTEELEKLGLDELRKQVDREIEDLMVSLKKETHTTTTNSKTPQKVALIKSEPKLPTSENDSAWTSLIDRVTLATDSIQNLFTTTTTTTKTDGHNASASKQPDPELLESVVRKQLMPSIRDFLSFGLIDPEALPQTNSYTSLIFNPYYILASLTCFPLTNKSTKPSGERGSIENKIHIWHVIEDYNRERNEVDFKNSSIRALSQSFALESSISGSIKMSSKQVLLIAIDGIISTLSNCKPNGPESHFKAFIYTALNRNKLTDWLRLIFKNKSIIRKHYNTQSFLNQSEKSDKFLAILKPLNKFQFKLNYDVEPIEQFVSAF